MMQVQVLPLTLAPMDPLVGLQLWLLLSNVGSSLLFQPSHHQSACFFLDLFDLA